MIIKTLLYCTDGQYYERTPPNNASSTPVDACTQDGVDYYLLRSDRPVQPRDVVERLRESARSKLTEAECLACGIR